MPPLLNREWLSSPKGHVIVYDLYFGPAFGGYSEIVHVAGMVAFGILQAMLFSIWIEMRTCRLEVRRIALRLGMEVEGVHPGRQVMERRLDHHSRRSTFPGLTREYRRSYALALSIF